MPPGPCMQGYQQPPQATPVHPSIQAIHTVLPPPQQPNVFSRPEVITSRRIGPTAVIVSHYLIKSLLLRTCDHSNLKSHKSPKLKQWQILFINLLSLFIYVGIKWIGRVINGSKRKA